MADTVPPTCTACGRVMPELEAAIDDRPYCHPADSTGVTCYMAAQARPKETRAVSDHLDELLGIDRSNTIQQLACELVEDHAELVSRLAAERKRLGLTQAEVAERMGTTAGKVDEFEKLDSDPRLSTVRRYAMAVGLRLVTTCKVTVRLNKTPRGEIEGADEAMEQLSHDMTPVHEDGVSGD